MTPERRRITVSARQAGSRLDQFLAEPLGSRSRAQQLIEADRVTVDGRTRAKRHVVAVGQVIEVELEATQRASEDAKPAAFSVAYEDHHLLVVDKPAGVVVHPARGHSSGTLAQALAGRAAGGDETARAGIVHRLDRDTSGLLVVAKDDAVHRALKSLLARRALHREYLALVEGHLDARTGTIDAPIGRDRRDRLRVSLDSDVPRSARTHFEVQRQLPATSLLRVWLETGRTHQIRVHLAAIDHPVCGDPSYGSGGRLGLSRQFLHAARLSFPHPVTGVTVEVVAPLPEDLRAALQRAQRDPAA